MDYTTNRENQIDYFNNLGIDTSFPGYYDDPYFLELEKKNPNLLNNYASIIYQTTFDRKYLEHAESVTKIFCESLYDELSKDGRQGACIDISCALSRMLEKEGIWNYVTKGSLTVSIPRGYGFKKKHFYTVDHGNHVAGHAWITAPPFQVIDLTVKEQNYLPHEKQMLPDFIFQKEVTWDNFNLEEVVAPHILQMLMYQFKNNAKAILKHLNPDWEIFTKFFKPMYFANNSIKFKYSPIGIAAPDLPLEEFTSLSLNGRTALEIYSNIQRCNLK